MQTAELNAHVHPIFRPLVTPEVLAAEYTNGSKTVPATLTINRIANGRRTFQSEHRVSGKREARMIAGLMNAKPWNF